MGHWKVGKQHHCGASWKPGNCRFPKEKAGCVIHEDYCKKHNWLFIRDDQSCEKCDIENEKAAKKAEEEKAKEGREKREKARAKDDHHMHHNLQYAFTYIPFSSITSILTRI
jgi:hypothetical protein